MLGTRVIFVEDDDDLRDGIASALSRFGLSVQGVSCALDFYRALAMNPCDVVLLDIGLPDQSGLEITRTLSSRAEIGIVILTASNSLQNRIEGFESGAQQYFSKPVDAHELAAAITSLAKKVRAANSSTPPPLPRTWCLARSGQTLTSPSGETLLLTPQETRLFTVLAESNGNTTTREDLMTALTGHIDLLDRHSLDSAIRRLRRKAEDELSSPLPLRTVHGIGYCLVANVVVTQ